jgi:hypothetical protein
MTHNHFYKWACLNQFVTFKSHVKGYYVTLSLIVTGADQHHHIGLTVPFPFSQGSVNRKWWIEG